MEPRKMTLRRACEILEALKVKWQGCIIGYTGRIRPTSRMKRAPLVHIRRDIEEALAVIDPALYLDAEITTKPWDPEYHLTGSIKVRRFESMKQTPADPGQGESSLQEGTWRGTED